METGSFGCRNERQGSQPISLVVIQESWQHSGLLFLTWRLFRGRLDCMGVRLLQFLNSIHVTEEKTTFNTSNQLDFTFGAVVCIRLDKGNTTQMLITIPVFLTR